MFQRGSPAMFETFGTLLTADAMTESAPVWIEDSGADQTSEWRGTVLLPQERAPHVGTEAQLMLEDGRVAMAKISQLMPGEEGKVLVGLDGTTPFHAGEALHQ